MYGYMVKTYSVSEAEDEMNAWAEEGWRVIAVSPNIFKGCGIVVTFEKEFSEEE